MRPNNDTLLRALRRQRTEYVPVWLMRQAGRYLPEYNATRARAGSFMRLCRDPTLATEVTLQPLSRFALDAAIVFSDILTVPDAMGLGLAFAEGDGPRFERPLGDEAAISRLEAPDLSRLAYVFDAVAAIKRALAGSVPLIGFAGSPFTLACYMIEGRGSADFARVRRLLYARPDLLHHVLAVNADAVAGYLVEQARHGADALMLFDTWGGLLTADGYATFSLAYMRRVLARLRDEAPSVPTIVFTRGGGQWLETIADSGCDAIGLDWTTNVAAARASVGSRVALQGNLDPQALLSTPRAIEGAAAAILRAAGSGPGFVFNLGHGVVPETPPEHVGSLVEFVHAESRRLAEGKTAENRMEPRFTGS
ncbi:MAG TPA: uroporphyrinogen decarboxylase [Casimicrobiaceae bacterium]|nr:uroporphyrinogen decarboxylase [Casimicrobiaceae bacterium]